MEYTNEFLARVYAAYMGCECHVLQENAKQSWYQKALLTGIKEGVMVEVQHIYDTYAEEEATHYEFNECQLLLTPLSEISDEDAIEVAKMFDASAPTSIFGRKVISYITDMANKPGWFNPDFEKIRLAFDKLREWGYDCGYAEIPSLIEAGIAIKTQ